jgi:RNA polymerase sigma factor (sigma-70 family)
MMRAWIEYVVRARAGDLSAFDPLVKEFQDMAVGYAYSILGDFQLAEDAAQDAFIEAYFCLGRLKEPKAFPAWFRTIVSRQCGRLTRGKQHPSVPLEAITELANPGLSPLDLAAQKETQGKILSAVNTLPEHERVATTLAYINGYSLAEVGDFLDVSVDNVKNRLRSARKKLRERMVSLVKETLKQHAPGDDFSRRASAVFETKVFQLIGVESEIDLSKDFSPMINGLWNRLQERRAEIVAAVQPEAWIGYWYTKWADGVPGKNPKVWFMAAVEVESLANIPEGLTGKALPLSSYAVFREKQRGEIGGPEGYAYQTWLPQSDYDCNYEVNGDLEVYRTGIPEGSSTPADIYIPIRPKK